MKKRITLWGLDFPTTQQIAEHIIMHPRYWRFPSRIGKGLEFKCDDCNGWHDTSAIGENHP